MPTHKAVAATGLDTIAEVDLLTPSPGAGEVLVEMKYAAFSPVDAYQVDNGFLLRDSDYPHVLGFAGAGIVHEVGEGVEGLKGGDRVTAFTYGGSKTKPLQRYCIVPQALVAKVPDSFPLDAAASMPDNYVTAMYTIFGSPCLRLTLPVDTRFPTTTEPPNADTPILVYGAGSSSGQYMIQALKLAGYTNIIATASPRHHDLLASLGAKASIDYRSEYLADLIRGSAGGRPVEIAIDCIGARLSIEAYAPAVAKDARVAILMPVKDGDKVYNGKKAGSEYHSLEFPKWTQDALSSAKLIPVYTFRNQDDPIGRDTFMPKILPQLLQDGIIKPNPLIVLDEGSMLERTEKALDMFRNNQVSGQKVVVEITY